MDVYLFQYLDLSHSFLTITAASWYVCISVRFYWHWHSIFPDKLLKPLHLLIICLYCKNDVIQTCVSIITQKFALQKATLKRKNKSSSHQTHRFFSLRSLISIFFDKRFVEHGFDMKTKSEYQCHRAVSIGPPTSLPVSRSFSQF